MKHRWFWRFAALMLFLAAIMTGALVMELQTTNMQTLRQNVEQYRLAGTAIRVSLIALIALAWPKLVRASEQRGHISIERSVELTRLCWRIVTWLLLIELFIGQNLLGTVWQAHVGVQA